MCNSHKMGSAANVTIEWKEHHDVLIEGLMEFLCQEHLVDTCITSKQGHSLKVHRLVLSIFLPALTKHSAALQELVISEQHNDVRDLVEFVYTGKVTVANERIGHLRRMAKKLDFKGLSKAIRDLELQVDGTSSSTSTTEDVHDDQDDPETLELPKSSEKLQEVTGTLLEDPVKRRKKLTNDVTNVSERTRSGELTENFMFSSAMSSGEASSSKNRHSSLEVKSKSTPRRKAGAKTRSRRKVTMCKVPVETAEEDLINNIDKQSSPSDDMKATSDDVMTVQKSLEVVESSCTSKVARPPTCKRCSKTFPTMWKLSRHRKTCGQNLPCKCQYCCYSAEQQEDLDEHVAVTHQDKIDKNFFKCSQCSFACNDRKKLRHHFIRQHDPERKQKCPICEYTAMYKSQITRHVRFYHHKERNYVCDMCGSRYQTSYRLNQHKRTKHQGIMPYKCHYCNKEFIGRRNFKIHVKVKHTGDAEMHVCHVCGKTSTTRWNLQGHMQRVHGLSLQSLKLFYKPREPEQTAEAEIDAAVDYVAIDMSNRNLAEHPAPVGKD